MCGGVEPAVGSGFIEVIPVTGDFDRNAPLRLSLRHPTLAAADLSLSLQPAADGWRAHTRISVDHDWTLQLDPGDGSWRILGRLSRHVQAARLGPALATP